MVHNLSEQVILEMVEAVGSILKAAHELGVPYRTLHNRCANLGITGSKRRVDWTAIQEDLNNSVSVRSICGKHSITRSCFDSAGVRRGKIHYPEQYGLTSYGHNLPTVPTRYNWKEVQQYYDMGYSYTDLIIKYGMSTSLLQYAKNNNWLSPRSSKASCALGRSLSPDRFHHKRTEEFKQHLRDHINKRYTEGWMPKAGRCKRYKYVSAHAGEVTLDGTWEVRVAQWLDSVSVKWHRNTKRFDYVGEKGEPRTYTPDFYVDDYDVYIEVKGYETNLDRLKWKCFPHTLFVWKLEQIEKLLEGELNGVLTTPAKRLVL